MGMTMAMTITTNDNEFKSQAKHQKRAGVGARPKINQVYQTKTLCILVILNIITWSTIIMMMILQQGLANWGWSGRRTCQARADVQSWPRQQVMIIMTINIIIIIIIIMMVIMIMTMEMKVIMMISFRSPSEFGGSLADSDSLRSRESNRPKLSEVRILLYCDGDVKKSDFESEVMWERMYPAFPRR